jgi:hypothetical protein
MKTEPKVSAPEKERLSLYPTPETAMRLRRVADIRKTSGAATGLWLLERALDWFEGLPRDERERH